MFFNEIRTLILEVISNYAEVLFERDVIILNNTQIVVETEKGVPPPYNGFYKKVGNNKTDKIILEEVTYENGKNLDFYDNHKKLAPEMQFMYENFVSKDKYQKFWNDFKPKYEEKKKRLEEAFKL